MHILHITREQGSDARYGIRKSLMPVIEALRTQGHHVELMDQKMAATIATNRLEKWLEIFYLKFMRYKFGKSGVQAWQLLVERVTIGRKAAKYAARNKVSHVHCHDPLLGHTYSFFAPFYGATRCWGYTVHAFGRFVKLRIGIMTNEKSLAHLQSWEKKAAHKAKWVVVPTKTGLTQMMHDLALKAPPIHWHVVPHAVIKHIGNRTIARQSLNLKEDEKLLIAVGQLIPMKRFSLLLESVVLLPVSLQPYILILGEGPEKEALQSQAKKLNLSKRFEIRATDNIGKYFSAADIYLSVSSTESFGMANCEAVLAGVPSICTAVDAVPELLNQCAILVNDKTEEISAALKRLLTSEVERKKLVAKANSITRLWPWPNEIALMMEHIYNKCNS